MNKAYELYGDSIPLGKKHLDSKILETFAVTEGTSAKHTAKRKPRGPARWKQRLMTEEQIKVAQSRVKAYSPQITGRTKKETLKIKDEALAEFTKLFTWVALLMVVEKLSDISYRDYNFSIFDFHDPALDKLSAVLAFYPQLAASIAAGGSPVTTASKYYSS